MLRQKFRQRRRREELRVRRRRAVQDSLRAWGTTRRRRNFVNRRKRVEETNERKKKNAGFVRLGFRSRFRASRPLSGWTRARVGSRAVRRRKRGRRRPGSALARVSRAPREERGGAAVPSASPARRPTSRVVEWVGTREEKPPHATRRTYLALRYVLRVRRERPEHAFRVRALVRVVAVVQHVAQLLELRERLRHGARVSPEGTESSTSGEKRISERLGGAIAVCGCASVRPRRCAVASLDNRRRVLTTPMRTP